MKKVLFLLLIILLFLIACSKSQPQKIVILTGSATKEVKNTSIEKLKELEKATVFFGITDKATSLENVTSVLISIDEISIHSNNGWKNITSDQKIFDLYKLKGLNLSELFSLAMLEQDSYDQISIRFSNAVVFRNGIAETSFLAGNSINFPVDLKLSRNNYVVIFDFILDSSLHETIENQLVFLPVVKLIINKADKVDLSSDRILRMNGVRQIFSKQFGLDEKGVARLGMGVSEGTELFFDNGKLILI